MNVALRRPWTLDRFLAWEERQALRYEFDGVGAVAMAGGTEAHAEIQRNVLIAVGTRLNRPPCRIVGSDLKIVAAGRVRYPDAVIVCSPRAAGRTSAIDPIIVFEILSAGKAQVDMMDKNAEYRAIPPIQRYVILGQAEAAAIAFSRKGEDWVSEILVGDGAILRLPEVGIELPLAELYRDIAFPAETGAPDAA
jgi:Uma2 family endonuclease